MNGHNQLLPYCRLTYWNGNSAAAPDEPWTVCIVAPRIPCSSIKMSFDNTPAGTRARDALLDFLEQAYESGRHSAKREIRDVLGIKEPRS